MLGLVIVESGWGSILPTVIIASMMHAGPAEKSGRLNIGDQIMTINGTSLVGLPLNTCQSIIKVGRPPPLPPACVRSPSQRHHVTDSLIGFFGFLSLLLKCFHIKPQSCTCFPDCTPTFWSVFYLFYFFLISTLKKKNKTKHDNQNKKVIVFCVKYIFIVCSLFPFVLFPIQNKILQLQYNGDFFDFDVDFRYYSGAGSQDTFRGHRGIQTQ